MANKKKQKLPSLSSEYKEQLASLAAKDEFKALETLFRIEENNIIVQEFKYDSPDPVVLARRRDWYKGRVYELRRIMRTFEEVRKEEK